MVEEPTPEDPGGETYELGETVRVGDLEVTVNGFRRSTTGGIFSPNPGHSFAYVDTTIKNVGSASTVVSAVLQAALIDSQGARYATDLIAEAANSIASLNGAISPGWLMRGEIGFQLPDEADGFNITVLDETLIGEQATFALGVATETPSPVAIADGEPSHSPEAVTSAFNSGDTAQSGDLEITVNGFRSAGGDIIYAPDSGRYFGYVDTTIRNTGEEAVQLSTTLQAQVRDAFGFSYAPDIEAEVANIVGTPSGKLPPGWILRGEVGFHLPERREGLYLNFQEDPFSTEQTIFALGTPIDSSSPLPITDDAPFMPPEFMAEGSHAIGETVLEGDLEITVNDFTSTEGSIVFPPEEGRLFAYVDVTFRNLDSEPKPISTILQASVRDPYGFSYLTHIEATADNDAPSPEGEIAPGETLTGEIAYELPASALGYFWTFSADLLGEQFVIFNLGVPIGSEELVEPQIEEAAGDGGTESSGAAETEDRTESLETLALNIWRGLFGQDMDALNAAYSQFPDEYKTRCSLDSYLTVAQLTTSIIEGTYGPLDGLEVEVGNAWIDGDLGYADATFTRNGEVVQFGETSQSVDPVGVWTGDSWERWLSPAEEAGEDLCSLSQ